MANSCCTRSLAVLGGCTKSIQGELRISPDTLTEYSDRKSTKKVAP